MGEDNTFKTLVKDKPRSPEYQAYRKEWDRCGEQLHATQAPVHLDIETSAICDLRCGGDNSFCQIWTHEHLRTEGFKDKRGPGIYTPGLMSPHLYFLLLDEAAEVGVKSLKLNYRGEPSMHPEIVNFVEEARDYNFVDIMMNTNGNGGARKNPDLFIQLVNAGITNLMFSADACTEDVYTKQRVGGDWKTLLYSVDSAVRARDYVASASDDCHIRVSAVRTKENRHQIDSGDFEKFWLDRGVDWVSVSECYFPAGVYHPWAVVDWIQMDNAEFQCADPFRRMVVTWNGKHTFPCCQGFPGAVDGGDVSDGHILRAWHSEAFNTLRKHHIARTWDQVPMCRSCPLTKKEKK